MPYEREGAWRELPAYIQGPALAGSVEQAGESRGRRGITRGEEVGGGKRARTADLLAASQTLSQLSYTPTGGVPAGPAGLEL
jgi:hypothetical protein